MPTTTRGSLPPGVYWRRRLFVGLLAVSLVFVIVSWLRGGSDASDDEAPAAEQAGAVEASQTITVAPTGKGKKGAVTRGAAYGPTADPTLLVAPEGTCSASDVIVRPRVEEAVAGRDVTIGLSLQTRSSEACTWQVSPNAVTVKINGANREIWSTRECSSAVPEQEVVVRRAIATVVEMTWNARESDPGCPSQTDWVMPGTFTVATAALGGEPSRLEFELETPTPETVTQKPKPKHSPTPDPTDSTAKPSTKATPRSGGDDSPGAEPRR